MASFSAPRTQDNSTECSETERALRESEQRYRTLFNLMDEGYCIIEFFDGPHGPLSDYVHVEANPAYTANAGIPNIVGQKVREMVPDEAEGWVEIYRNVLLTGQPIRFERELVATKRHLELSAFRIEPAERRQVAVLFRDITERKQARAAEATLAAIVQNSDDAIISKGLDGVITSWNTGAERLFGYTAAEAISQPVTMLIPADRLEEEPRIIERLKRGERVAEFETQRVRKDGSLLDVSVTISPIKDETGRVVGASKIARDISDRKAAEQGLRDALADTQLLHRLAMDMAQPATPPQLYERLVDAAVEIMRSDFASLQMLYPERGERGELRLLACRGYDPAAARFWEWVRTDSSCTCGIAMRSGQRAHATDVRTCDFMAGSADQANALRMGMLAMQSTPLISRSGELLGMISTHWKKPHQPTERDWRLFDVLARHAADLIERNKAEETLRDSEQMRRFSQQAAGVGTWTWDNKSSEVTWSAETYDLFGIDPQTRLLYDSWRNAVHPDDRNRANAAAQNAMQRGENLNVEYRIQHPARGERWLVSLGRIVDPLNRPGYMTGVSMDITDRKLTEVELKRSEDQLRLITDAVPGLISYIDQELCYRFVNRQYEEWFGHAPGEIVGKSVYEVLGEAAMQHLRPYMDMALGGGAARFEDEVPYREGGTRWIDAQYIPHRDERGQVPGFFVLVLDITHRKHAEKALQEADRRKSEFLAVLAHELRNPLAPIRNAAQILSRSPGDQAVLQSTTDMLQRQVGQMARLVDDLLDISRISQGKIELQKERVELASVIHHTVEAARPLSERLEHELTLALPAEPIYLDADPTRLAQIFGNLLTNACKFTNRGGHIRLAIERAGADVVIAVKDDGIGIAADQLARIFEMFTQIDTSLERTQTGLGIGLTLVKNLVEMHGGTIEARSAGVGRGSEFVVRLPVAANAPQPAPEKEKPVDGRAAARRILVVDDNRDAAQSLAMLLKLSGHRVHTAHDGLAAVEAAAEVQPDVILLDIGLPKLNGYEAARRIREQQKDDLLLVALTGWGQEEDRRKSEDAGFDAHLIKPVELSTLAKLLAARDSR